MSKPLTFPTAFPTDQRRRLRQQPDGVWIATHPDRIAHAYIDGKWQPINQQQSKAA